MNHVDVVCAVIRDQNNKIFCCKRGPGRALEGFWEFPGGKVEEHESHEETIIREIKEELESDILPIRYIGVSNYEYDNLDKPFSISLYAYECRLIKGELKITEHIEKTWLTVDELDNMSWAEADKPIVELIKNI